MRKKNFIKWMFIFMTMTTGNTKSIYAESTETKYGLFHYQSLLASKPTSQGSNVKVWNIKQTSVIRVNLIEMKGELPLHKHPDADHSIMVLEGSLIATVGESKLTLNKGDFLTISKDIPHKYNAISATVYFVSMDAPYYDPNKTVRLQRSLKQGGLMGVI